MTATSAAVASTNDIYTAIKLQHVEQTMSNSRLTSPRVSNRVDAPDRQTSFSGALAVGYVLEGGWRLEGEYTTRNRGNFTSYWAPFNANVNNLRVESERFMLNGYKDFPVTERVSVYATTGLGVARVSADGYQTTTDRRFARNTQNNLAYSAGLGLDVDLGNKLTVGAGYRYLYMGNVETGYNTFANRINARDEQLKGRLHEQNLFLSLRQGF
ncbi:porin family protein [Pseudomonas gingeri]|uniref:Porin family protein n=2 Tax=Pseudomonas gingeri TaxID=117681 RepID=A0A7Y7YEB2_9PSED|nr:porin family protein [Pseudomonas gingeri]NWC34901.1 porin family protein [Pseudomonas gingeri]NWD05341.1 porin family protein [Pseudomonas gingeri]NWD47721.1 porin family protein [Pseudomonas gingeri]NWE30456.1 porin family protein [Pseudomonas gingeri]